MQQASGSTNKRTEARKPANGRGRAVFADGNFADCTIIDISVSGARIRLTRKSTLPSRFFLLDVKSRMVHAASVAWQEGDYAGVRFEVSHVIGSALPPELDFMRKHWLECAMR
ncbi:MAG: PilZ domain-containing protein [Alphaproteobacteria bacterium]|nr:PilZ domain-containing protein [Alphaproteobacteria bacterium]